MCLIIETFNSKIVRISKHIVFLTFYELILGQKHFLKFYASTAVPNTSAYIYSMKVYFK